MGVGNGADRPLRTVVCGTTFGQVYLEAFHVPGLPFELVGVLSRGSERSRACAAHYGVPLFTDADQLPDEVDVACVVIRGGLLGGAGSELARTLLGRGIHVLQEHPVHADELAGNLAVARRHEVVYHLNPFYRHLAPVRGFLASAHALLAIQRPLYIEAVCGFQVAYALLDILGAALGRVRPWGFVGTPELPAEIRRLGAVPPAFRTVEGMLAGVPVTLRVQNQLDPGDPDNFAHLLHRITLGTEGGNLTLMTTHGPIVWSERPQIPRQVRDAGAAALFAEAVSPSNGDRSGACVLGPSTTRGQHETFTSLWPHGVAHALTLLRQAIIEGEDPRQPGQYHLALCKVWQDIARQLGPPELIRCAAPRPLTTQQLSTVTAALRGIPVSAP